MAELLRRGADLVLQRAEAPSAEARRERALAVVGAFASGHDDIAARHDRELDRIYADS